jgi:hypothetical protein
VVLWYFILTVLARKFFPKKGTPRHCFWQAISSLWRAKTINESFNHSQKSPNHLCKGISGQIDRLSKIVSFGGSRHPGQLKGGGFVS